MKIDGDELIEKLESELVEAVDCEDCAVNAGISTAIDIAKRMSVETGHGNYECFHCCTKSVIWDADFDFEDFGYEGEGIVHICHCANCGAEIEYRVRTDNEEEDG